MRQQCKKVIIPSATSKHHPDVILYVLKGMKHTIQNNNKTSNVDTDCDPQEKEERVPNFIKLNLHHHWSSKCTSPIHILVTCSLKGEIRFKVTHHISKLFKID